MPDHKRKVTKTFDSRAGTYDSESLWVRASSLLRPLVPYPQPLAKRFLDICAGTGSVSDVAVARGWNVVAIDRNVHMLSLLRSGSVSKVCADALKLPFRAQSVDLAVNRQGLHYLDVASAIREMFRVTKHQIRLGHITMFDVSDLPVWTEYFETVSPGRRRIFAPGDISSEIKSAGGVVKSCRVVIASDDFDGPIKHLGQDRVRTMRTLFRSAPKSFKEKYVLETGGHSDFRLRLRWEFICAERRRSAEEPATGIQ